MTDSGILGRKEIGSSAWGVPDQFKIFCCASPRMFAGIRTEARRQPVVNFASLSISYANWRSKTAQVVIRHACECGSPIGKGLRSECLYEIVAIGTGCG